MEKRLVAVGAGGPHPLAFSGATPVRGRGDGAVERGEADQDALAPIALPGQLAHIQLTTCTHLGGACVAHV